MFAANRWLKCFQKVTPKRLQKAPRREPISVERLEDRVLLYATSGNAWPNKDLITISFMPDGTELGGNKTSDMFATLNAKFGTAATWQNQILKAAQYWAQQTNINFALVTDNGAAAGSGSYQQGDPNFGDIRIGGYKFGNSTLAQAFLPPPVNNYSIAGDIQLNTGITFNVGSQYDLFTVALHEFGHALGVYHSTTTTATMYSAYNGVDSALNADDISGIKAIYSAGAVRTIDSYDKTKSNSSTSAASVLTLNATTKSAVVNGLDLTTSTDVDYFKIVVPAGSTTTLKATVVSTGLSLLSPKVEIVVGSTTKATGAAGATEYGSSETATYTNTTDLAAGKTVYIKVSSANSLAAFKTGKYALVLNMGTGADPAITKPNTTLANGTTLSSGGGYAESKNLESTVNMLTLGVQQTSDRAVATAINGDFVTTWASNDGSGWDVYAQRFNRDGVKQGTEFLVSQTTAGDQVDPVVAMDVLGNFLVSWSSAGQDGSGSGIYARRFNSQGVAFGNEFRVNTTTANDQSAPSLAMDAIGDAIITWTSSGQDGSGSGVYGQRYSFLGSASGGEFRINTATSGDQSDSAVVMNRLTGEFVATWSSAGQDGSGLGVYAQRFSVSGSPVGSEFRVNTVTTNDQSDPSIAINRFTGDFVVTWTSAAQDGSGTGIYAQRYNATGVAQGTAFPVNTTTAGDQNDSSVAMDGGGNIFITWAGSTTTNGWQVYRQQFTQAGTKYESESLVNTTAAGDQNRASVAIDFFGQVVVVWSGNAAADSAGIQIQLYTTDKERFEPNGHEHHDAGHESHEETIVAPRSNQHESQGQTSQVVSASATETRQRWVEAIHRRDAAEASANSRPSAAIRSKPRAAAELSESIDNLFGSEAWLNGRHYRKSS